MVRDQLLRGLRLLLADRGALLEPPGGGAEVEGADVELVDDERPAGLDQLAEPAAGLLERLDVVEGDDRDRGRERGRGLVEIGEGDGADVVAVRLRVDRHHVIAVRPERAGEAAGAGADLEHARGRGGQVRADEGPQVDGRHPGIFPALYCCRSRRRAGPSAWPPRSTGSNRSPCCSTRCSASRLPKSRGRTFSPSSSQRSGVETGAPSFGRTE